MTIANVELSNTFNQFRTTTNDVIQQVNKLSDGTGTLTIDSITANTFVGANLSISANSGTDTVSLVTETLRVVGTNGISTSVASSSNTINVNLDTSGVTAGAYGSASKVPQLVIDAQGRVTSASNVNVAGVSAFNYHSGNANFQISTADGGSFTASIGQHLGTSANVTFQQLTVSGNLTVTGTTTTVSANNLAIKDNLIYLNNESSNTNVDLGFAGNYNDGVYRHAGLFRDADDGIWKFFDSYTPEPDASANLNTSNASFQLAKVSAGSIVATGNSVITVADNTNAALRITQTGTGDAILVEDSANPDATPFVIDASGNVVIGDTGLRTGPYGLQPIAQVSGATLNTSSGLFVDWANNDTTGPALLFAKAKSGIRGTQGAVVNGTRLFFQTFSGSDGTNFIPAAQIEASVDGTPGTNDMPGRLTFSTTADGSFTPTERMRIDSYGAVGVGTSSLAGYSLRVGKNITNGTSGFGVASNGGIQSDVTSAARMFISQPSTAAAAFTLPILDHYLATQGTIGAGSTVTNQYGFSVSSTLTGATNNYGFYSDIASGTNRWNFYANGTADNYFAGSVGIGGTPIAGFKVSNYGNLSGATTAYSYYAGSTFQSDVTTNGIGFGTFLGTQAASFTLTSLTHFRTAQGTFGASSTVTNQFGFEATNTLTGATNNYGFYSNIASGTGRWNFYANGTAQNYFAGNTLIGSTSSSPVGKLTVLSDRASISYNTVFSTYNGASFENDFILGFNGTVTNVGNYQNFPIVFVANNSEGLRITGSGTISLGAAPGSESLRVTRVTSAVNYLEAQGQITTGGPSLIAAGSDTNIDLLFKSKGTGSINSYTNSTVLQFQVAHLASAVNYIQATGAATSGSVVLSAVGSDSNPGFVIQSKGTGIIDLRTSTTTSTTFGIELGAGNTVDRTTFIDFHSSSGTDYDFRIQRNSGANNFAEIVNVGTGGMAFKTNTTLEQFRIGHTASAVNYIQATGAGTGALPGFFALGSDTNVSIGYRTKGTGSHVFYSDDGSNPQFSISRTGSSVNYIQATGAITGGTPTFSAIGSDTNISMNFAPKGSGGVSITESTGAQSVSKVLTVQSGSYSVWVNPRFSAGSYNPLTSANSAGLIFTNSASQSGNGIFLLAPWSDIAAGIRISQSSHTANTTIASNTLLLAATTTVDGALTATSVSAATLTGVAAVATVSNTATLTADNTTNATNYLTFVNAATGNQALRTDIGLSFNPSTNTLTTSAVSAPTLTGVAAVATVGNTVTLTADDSTNATRYPLFSDAATGNVSPRTDTGFTYNPSTGVLTATAFSGSGASLTNIPNSATTASASNGASTIVARDASGSFTTNGITATSVSAPTLTGVAAVATVSNTSTLTADNTTNATNYLTFVNAATGNQALRTDIGLSFNPSTNTLTTTTFSGAFSGSGASLTSIPNSATTASASNGASTIVARSAAGGIGIGFFDETVTALTLSGGNTAVDWNLGAVWNITLTANSTIYFTNPPSSNRARTVTLFVKNSGATQKALTVTGARYTDGSVPILSSGNNAVDALSFITIDGGLNYYGSFILANLS